MDDQLKAVLEGINGLKNSQEETKNELKERMENMQRSQEETKERMAKGQEDLRNILEKKIDSVEEKIALKRVEDLEKKLLASGNATNKSKFVPASPVHVPSSAVPLTASPVSVKLSTYEGKTNLEYFVDDLKEGEIQKAVKMADVQDLKSALKLEAANEASCRDSHFVRGTRVTTDTPESP
ncbi:hypothetical protein TNCV_1104541 [Trichonephila clavipes]|nr:hypothetical protein TNCV_1104541 [Trichonephila clavipes]